MRVTMLTVLTAVAIGFLGMAGASAAPVNATLLKQSAGKFSPVEQVVCRVHRWCEHGRCWVHRHCW